MCYSVRTSVISFTTAIISAIFAFSTRQYVIGILILFYSQMQLAEGIIWKGIDDNNIGLNKFGTAYGKYLLPTHPFAVGLGILISAIVLGRSIGAKTVIPLIVGAIFYMVIVLGPYNAKYPNVTYPARKCSDRSCQSNENRLRWPFPHKWYLWGFILCIIFCGFFCRPVSAMLFAGLVFAISFGICYLIFPYTVGSFWCIAAAFLAPLIVGVNYFIVKDLSNSEVAV